MISDNQLWLLSFYRASEINGSLFFGRLARSMRSGPVQRDMTRHYSDEAAHAWYWTSCIEELGAKPIRLMDSYQDAYLEAAGMPANLMEVLAITQVFEKRVIGQYALHRRIPGLQPEIVETIDKIMEDERWHVKWIGDALNDMKEEYSSEVIKSTIQSFTAADKEVYDKTLKEHEERLLDLAPVPASFTRTAT